MYMELVVPALARSASGNVCCFYADNHCMKGRAPHATSGDSGFLMRTTTCLGARSVALPEEIRARVAGLDGSAEKPYLAVVYDMNRSTSMFQEAADAIALPLPGDIFGAKSNIFIDKDGVPDCSIDFPSLRDFFALPQLVGVNFVSSWFHIAFPFLLAAHPSLLLFLNFFNISFSNFSLFLGNTKQLQ